MSRGRKLLLVGLVLAVGLGLAWPFRRTADDKSSKAFAKAAFTKAQALKISPAESTTTRQSLSRPAPMGSPAPHVAAKMTSALSYPLAPRGQSTRTRETATVRHRSSSSLAASFDLANHPALASSLTSAKPTRAASPVTPAVPPKVQSPPSDYRPAQVQMDSSQMDSGQTYSDDARPAYATTDRDRAFSASETREAEVRHVVQNSDTLEKLAKRYLGSEDRSLEIFDLNRDVLDNPHLLPIDAELRIPTDTRKASE